MDFKPHAFKYLHQMCSPGGQFATFNVPTSVEVKRPGFYYPMQGRMWRISRAVADELFGISITAVIVDHYVIEAWKDRSSTNQPQFELVGYALILSSDIEKVIGQGTLIANIVSG